MKRLKNNIIIFKKEMEITSKKIKEFVEKVELFKKKHKYIKSNLLYNNEIYTKSI